MRRLFRRACLTGIAALAALSLSTVVGAEPAHAYPSGCLSTATSFSWSNNCWAGSYSPYDKYGEYSLAVQRILRGHGFYGGSADGIYGSGTRSAVANYQSSRGLGSDGVTGTNTWNELRYDMTVCGQEDHGHLGYETMYQVGSGMPCGWIFVDVDGSNNPLWYVLNTAGSCWKPMSTAGPSGGC